MQLSHQIKVNAESELQVAVFSTLFEDDEHIEEFMARPDYKLSDFNDEAQVIPLITAPLFRHWAELS